MTVVQSFVARICAVLSLALLTLGVDAATLDRLRSFVRETQTLRATFDQTVYDRSGRKLQQASGELSIVRPGKFRWSVQKPYKQLLVGDGERVWVYDEDLKQVVTRRNDQALGNTPAALLAGTAEVEAAFDWRELPPADGLDWLAATPKSKESSFSEIRLGFDGVGLAALELADNFGQRTVIRLTNVERNPRIPPDQLRFTPPKGVDVITD
jgi:outer membrane lipoprotein carrier protein